MDIRLVITIIKVIPYRMFVPFLRKVRQLNLITGNSHFSNVEFSRIYVGVLHGFYIDWMFFSYGIN